MISDDKHVQILKNHDMDVSASSTVRDERIPDLPFARWSQLDDTMNDACTTEFMGEFNIIGRERKAIQSEFRQNEVEIKFRTKDGDDDDLDDLMQGKWRTDTRLSKAQQCFKIAQDDAMDCGFGAWRLGIEETDPEDSLSTEKDTTFHPIPEAIRCVFFDLNSKLYDKSDAMRCSVLTGYSQEAYKQFLEDEGIDQDEAGFVSFDSPYRSIYEIYYDLKMSFPLYSNGNKEINLLEYFEIDHETEMMYQYLSVDETGQEKIIAIPKKEAESVEIPEDYIFLAKKKVKVKVCRKYITNGVKVLKESIVPGGHIPVIPMYAERNFVDGVENFYGIVKAAKDPQKLFNAVHNYLASLMMYSPIPKPIYDPREIEGFEDDYDEANNHELAYLRKNKYYEENGEFKQFAPEYTQPAPVPPAVATLMQQMPGLMDSILNPGVTEDSFDSNMSGVALQQITQQIGIMRYILLDNYGESMQRCAEVYAAMNAAVIDTPRMIVVTNPDGTTKIERVNEPSFDMVMMTNVIKNEIKDAKFNIYSKVGPTYASAREASLGNLKEVYSSFTDPNDPMAKLVQLSILSQQDGQGLDEINKVARFQMLSMNQPGIEPQTEEEIQFVEMMQQQAAQQQDPTAQLAAAEAEARLNEGMAARQNEENDANKLLIDKQKVDNDTARVQIEAAKAGIDIQVKQQDLQKNQLDMFDKQVTIEGKQIDNAKKISDEYRQDLQMLQSSGI